MQVFSSSETPSSALYRLIRSYTKIFALFFGYFIDFSYLCIIKQAHLNKHQFLNKIILIILISFLNKKHYATSTNRKQQPAE